MRTLPVLLKLPSVYFCNDRQKELNTIFIFRYGFPIVFLKYLIKVYKLQSITYYSCINPHPANVDNMASSYQC